MTVKVKARRVVKQPWEMSMAQFVATVEPEPFFVDGVQVIHWSHEARARKLWRRHIARRRSADRPIPREIEDEWVASMSYPAP